MSSGSEPRSSTTRNTEFGIRSVGSVMISTIPEAADALHALKDLGSYGEFHVAANGTRLTQMKWSG